MSNRKLHVYIVLVYLPLPLIVGVYSSRNIANQKANKFGGDEASVLKFTVTGAEVINQKYMNGVNLVKMHEGS